MEVKDSAQAHYTIEGRGTVVTSDRCTVHKKYGPVRIRTHRSIGNDSGLKAKMTREILAAHEPDVGLWPGDLIEVFDKYGQLIEVIHGH